MFRDFNFAREPFRNARLPRLIFAAVAAATLLVTVIHGFVLASHLLRERQDVDIHVETLRQELGETQATIADARTTLQEESGRLRGERTRFLSRLYRRKGFSWTGLFNELEEITPAAVRITSIAPAEDDGEITVTMSLVGRSLPDVIEMVRALEGSEIFDAVFPLDEVDLEEDEGGGVAATLNLNYIEKQLDEPDVSDAADAEGEGAPEDDTEGDDDDASEEEDAPAEMAAPEEASPGEESNGSGEPSPPASRDDRGAGR